MDTRRPNARGTLCEGREQFPGQTRRAGGTNPGDSQSTDLSRRCYRKRCAEHESVSPTLTAVSLLVKLKAGEETLAHTGEGVPGKRWGLGLYQCPTGVGGGQGQRSLPTLASAWHLHPQ